MRFKTFSGGVHPPEFKHLTEHKIIEAVPLPEEVIIPLQQHIGAPAECIVEKGMTVQTGQPLSKATKFVSVPVHASISGIIKAIENRPHPLGNRLISVVIEGNGEDDSFIPFMTPPDDLNSLPVADVKQWLQKAGMTGMGGASFPTHVKLSPPQDKKIDTLLINAAECEPFLTSDHRLMLEKTDEVIQGIKILMHILHVSRAYIGIEKNKPDAIQLLIKKTKKFKKINVVPLPVKYPQGGEKQLIQSILNRRVPAGGLPMDVGCIVQNVGTSVGVYEALAQGKPFIERVVTVTGPGIAEPKNCLVRIGTPFKHLIAFCGGYTMAAAKIINGGPMMGITQVTDEVPVIKGTSGILVLDDSHSRVPEEKPCISCSRCVDICPMKLIPSHIAGYIENKRIAEAESLGLMNCIECGSCSYICPAKRHLVHYIKFGKLLVNQQKAQ